MSEVEKEEVEDLLKRKVPDDLFQQALIYAKKKQAYIYSREKRAVVMQHWYLVVLTAEFVGCIAFSAYTVELCRKKEHPKNRDAQLTTSIVTVSAI